MNFWLPKVTKKINRQARVGEGIYNTKKRLYPQYVKNFGKRQTTKNKNKQKT